MVRQLVILAAMVGAVSVLGCGKGSTPSEESSGSAPATVDAPAGYTVAASTDSGKSLVTQKANVGTVNAALLATFPELATYFGNKPTIGSAYQDAHDASTGGATFGAVYHGQSVRGIVSCKIHDGAATVAVIFGRNDAPKSDWAKLMSPPAPQAMADGTGVGGGGKQFDYSDGTGSLTLPEGWTAQGSSVLHPVVIAGPGNQTIFLHVPVTVQTPDSMAVRQRQQMETMQAQNRDRAIRMGITPGPVQPLEPLVVAPFTDAIGSVQVLMPETNKKSEFYKGPTLTFGRMVSSQELPCQRPDGKRASVDFTCTQHFNGNAVPLRVQAEIMTCPMAGSAWLRMTQFAVQSPEANFDQDLPGMMAIVKSEKVDQQKAAQVAAAENQQMQQAGQAMMDAAARQREASYNQFQHDQQVRADIHQQQMQQTQAGYDAHNQKFRDNQLQRSRSAADFNESIIGTRTIYDTVTGQSGYAKLTDVNGVVDSLNQAALDPNRFVQIPLRDQLYPVGK